MKTTGRVSEFDRVNLEPEKPFLRDLKEDLEKINNSMTPKESIKTKKKMIELILKDL